MKKATAEAIANFEDEYFKGYYTTCSFYFYKKKRPQNGKSVFLSLSRRKNYRNNLYVYCNTGSVEVPQANNRPEGRLQMIGEIQKSPIRSKSNMGVSDTMIVR